MIDWSLIESSRQSLIGNAKWRGAEDPEGVVQTAMLRLWLRSQQPGAHFEPRAAFAYLYRAIATIIIDEARRPYPEASGTLSIDPERATYQHVMYLNEELHAAIRALPEAQRIAITRRRLDNWEVADLVVAYPNLYPSRHAAYDAADKAMNALKRRMRRVAEVREVL